MRTELDMSPLGDFLERALLRHLFLNLGISKLNGYLMILNYNFVRFNYAIVVKDDSESSKNPSKTYLIMLVDGTRSGTHLITEIKWEIINMVEKMHPGIDLSLKEIDMLMFTFGVPLIIRRILFPGTHKINYEKYFSEGFTFENVEKFVKNWIKWNVVPIPMEVFERDRLTNLYKAWKIFYKYELNIPKCSVPDGFVYEEIF